MQQVLFHQARHTKFQTQATYMLPGHGTGTKIPASNDEIYQDENSAGQVVLSVLANVVGGALLLSGLLSLPYVLAEILF